MLRAEYPAMKKCMKTILMHERGLEAEKIYMK